MKKVSVFLCFLLLPGIAYADMLVLKSGKTISGKILQEDSEFVQIEYNGAPVYFERKAIRQIDKDSAVACSNADSCLQLGLEVYASQGQPGSEESARAKKYFQQGLICEPENQDLRGIMAIVDDMDKGAISKDYAALLMSSSYYLMKNEYEKGISSLEKALAINPADTNILYNLGLAHHMMGRDQKSLSYLKKLIDIDPVDAQSYSLAGVVSLAAGDRQQAKEYLVIARELFEKGDDREKIKDIDSIIASSF